MLQIEDARDAKHDRGNRRPINCESIDRDEEGITLAELEERWGIDWGRRGRPNEWSELRTQDVQSTFPAPIDP